MTRPEASSPKPRCVAFSVSLGRRSMSLTACDGPAAEFVILESLSRVFFAFRAAVRGEANRESRLSHRRLSAEREMTSRGAFRLSAADLSAKCNGSLFGFGRGGEGKKLT